MNVVVRTTWHCSARHCTTQHEDAQVLSVFAAMDPRMVMPRPSPPEGWHVIEGLAYCGAHQVEATATIRTPIVVQLNGALGNLGRVFVGGDLVEQVRLRNAA